MRAKRLVVAGFAFAVCSVCLQADGQDVRLKPDATSARLVEAVKAGDKAAVATLLRQKADVNAAEPDGTTVLQWAVRQDDVELTDRLLRAGAEVKTANRYGITALYLASLNGSAAVIEKLIKAGADANAAVTEGETALMTAARSGHVPAAKVLIARGATVDARELWRGQTALMWAAAEGHPDMIRELAAHGADVNARSATQKWERQVTAEPREKWLPPGGLTPMYFASRQGCVECVKTLASLGADVNAVDQEGISPLVSAIINGHFDVAGALLDLKADPNIADSTGRTPLYAAVDMNTVPASNRPAPNVVENQMSGMDLIAALLDHGANPNARLKKQQPYRTKVDRGNDTMLGAGTTAFLRAARAGDAAGHASAPQAGRRSEDRDRLGYARRREPARAACARRHQPADGGGRARLEGRRHGRPEKDGDAVHRSDPGVSRGRRGHQCGRRPRPDRSLRRRAAGLRRGRAVPPRPWREGRHQRPARLHGARCRRG